MIEAILPAMVASATAVEDPEGVVLFAVEEAAIARAVDKRRREFRTTRWCARRALAQLGIGPVPLPSGRRGAPRWPAGVVGSLTHCAGFRAAAVAHAEDVAGIGIDAEPDAPLPDGVRQLVALPEEDAWLRTYERDRSGVCWDRLLFSAKESVFKTWYPLTGLELDFREAEMSIDRAEPSGGGAVGTFTARLRVPGPVVGGVRVDAFHGRWLARDGLLVTSIVLPAPRADIDIVRYRWIND